MYDKGIKTPAQYSGKKQYMKGNEYWQRSFIQKILHNQVYAGAVVSHTTSKVSYKIKKCVRVPKEEWIIVENMHEPIISKEQFNEVQRLMKERTSTRNRKHDHVLKGITKCGVCGGNMTIKADTRTEGKVRLSFICSNKNGNRLNCDNSVISCDIVLNKVLKSIREECKKILFNKVELTETLSEIKKSINSEKYEIQDKIKKVNQKIEKLDTQIKLVYDDKLNGILAVDDFMAIYQTKKEEREKLINQKKELQIKLNNQENTKTINYNDLYVFANDFLKIEYPTKEIISNLVETVTINKGRKIKIKYKFSKV